MTSYFLIIFGVVAGIVLAPAVMLYFKGKDIERQTIDFFGRKIDEE
ncbi:hypothetical protein ACFYU8_18015 [Brevibacillus sp. NPDC003359]